MQIESGKRALRNTVRMSLFALPLLGMGALNAQTVDLVAHNGFESCWSKALTKPQFLGLMRSSLDDQVTCIGPQTTTGSGFTVTTCNTAACPGGQTGCPVTLRAGIFSGDFPTGTFAAPGSADNIEVPVMVTAPFSLSCTVSISSITLTFAPDYSMIADGNSGLYAAELTQAPVSLNSFTVFSSNQTCQSLADANQSAFSAPAEAAATTAVEAQLRVTTVGESICPLTP